MNSLDVQTVNLDLSSVNAKSTMRVKSNVRHSTFRLTDGECTASANLEGDRQVVLGSFTLHQPTALGGDDYGILSINWGPSGSETYELVDRFMNAEGQLLGVTLQCASTFDFLLLNMVSFQHSTMFETFLPYESYDAKSPNLEINVGQVIVDYDYAELLQQYMPTLDSFTISVPKMAVGVRQQQTEDDTPAFGMVTGLAATEVDLMAKSTTFNMFVEGTRNQKNTSLAVPLSQLIAGQLALNTENVLLSTPGDSFLMSYTGLIKELSVQEFWNQHFQVNDKGLRAKQTNGFIHSAPSVDMQELINGWDLVLAGGESDGNGVNFQLSIDGKVSSIYATANLDTWEVLFDTNTATDLYGGLEIILFDATLVDIFVFGDADLDQMIFDLDLVVNDDTEELFSIDLSQFSNIDDIFSVNEDSQSASVNVAIDDISTCVGTECHTFSFTGTAGIDAGTDCPNWSCFDDDHTEFAYFLLVDMTFNDNVYGVDWTGTVANTDDFSFMLGFDTVTFDLEYYFGESTNTHTMVGDLSLDDSSELWTLSGVFHRDSEATLEHVATFNGPSFGYYSGGYYSTEGGFGYYSTPTAGYYSSTPTAGYYYSTPTAGYYSTDSVGYYSSGSGISGDWIMDFSDFGATTPNSQVVTSVAISSSGLSVTVVGTGLEAVDMSLDFDPEYNTFTINVECDSQWIYPGYNWVVAIAGDLSSEPSLDISSALTPDNAGDSSVSFDFAYSQDNWDEIVSSVSQRRFTAATGSTESDFQATLTTDFFTGTLEFSNLLDDDTVEAAFLHLVYDFSEDMLVDATVRSRDSEDSIFYLELYPSDDTLLVADIAFAQFFQLTADTGDFSDGLSTYAAVRTDESEHYIEMELDTVGFRVDPDNGLETADEFSIEFIFIRAEEMAADITFGFVEDFTDVGEENSHWHASFEIQDRTRVDTEPILTYFGVDTVISAEDILGDAVINDHAGSIWSMALEVSLSQGSGTTVHTFERDYPGAMVTVDYVSSSEEAPLILSSVWSNSYHNQITTSSLVMDFDCDAPMCFSGEGITSDPSDDLTCDELSWQMNYGHLDFVGEHTLDWFEQLMNDLGPTIEIPDIWPVMDMDGCGNFEFPGIVGFFSWDAPCDEPDSTNCEVLEEPYVPEPEPAPTEPEPAPEPDAPPSDSLNSPAMTATVSRSVLFVTVLAIANLL